MSDLLPAIRNTFLKSDEGYDLEKVVEWTEKGLRQQQGKHPAFDAGDLVKVKGFIEYDDERGLRLHVDADGRVADNFYLVNPVNPEQAKVYGGLPLESVVKVLGFREESFQISNIQNYDAGRLDVTALPLINPTQTDINSTANNQAVIYGEFVGFKDSGEARFLRSLGFPEGTKISGESSTGRHAHLSIKLPDGGKTSVDVDNPPRDYHVRATQGVIRTEDGREIEVNMPTGRTVYSGGNMENIKDKLPEKGDVLRISTRISDSGFFAHWCDPCFLVDPSEERYSRSENLRLTLDANLNQTSQYIEGGQFSEARALLAEVRAHEVTEAQLDRTYELAQQIPAAERPMLTDKKDYTRTRENNSWVSSIDKAYGVRLESMTEQELVSFTRKAVTGEVKQSGEHADTSYLFGIVEDLGLSSEVQEELVVSCIDARLGRIRGKPYNHDTDFDDKYNTEQALKYLGSIGTESSTRKLFDYVRSFVEDGDYKEIGWRDQDRSQRPEDFLFAAVSALSGSVDKLDPATLTKEIPYMRQVIGHLKQHADEPNTLDVLERTMPYAEKRSLGTGKRELIE
jgi:hypothetical protein